MARKPISKRVRFEVFKRDSFTCQYCGSKSPDVVLHVDHIKPVKRGGGNDLMNLVTSCESCNLGKSSKPLSDYSTVELQRAQVAALSERREQLKMMMQWRDGLAEIDKIQLEIAVGKFNDMFSEYVLSEIGEKNLGKLVKKHGLESVLNHMQTAFEKATKNNNGIEDISATLANIGKLISVQNMSPVERNSRYICGILRNKFGDIDTKEYMGILSIYSADELQELINKLMFNKIRSLNGFDNEINPF